MIHTLSKSQIIKKILKISSLILLLIPINAFAGDSITYSIAAKMIDTTERFSLTLFYSIAEAYKPLYTSIATIGLLLILTKYLFTRVAPLREMTSFFVALTLSSAIAFDADLFKEVVYDTFFDTLYSFDQFVIQASASNMPNIAGVSFDSLSGMFRTIDTSLMEISNFAFGVTEDNKGWTDIPLFIEACFIYLLYLFIGTYFLVIFTISIFGAHMMIIMMPITISLYPFKRFRHYAGNCINGMLHYGLVTVFACVAISLVVFISNDLVVEANKLREEAAATGRDLTIPADFLTASIMIGFLSIFVIKISTEFASRVLNSASSQLGGAFPMIVAGATMLARNSTTIAKATTAGAIAYGARGLANSKSGANK
jgi:hypothetical protein